MTGKNLYQVYGSVTDFKNYQGNPMPEWEDLPEKIQLAWTAVSDFAGTERIEQVLGETKLEPRELSQIWHALAYADHHSDAGIPGHGQFMLIAKLAKALGYKHD